MNCMVKIRNILIDLEAMLRRLPHLTRGLNSYGLIHLKETVDNTSGTNHLLAS